MIGTSVSWGGWKRPLSCNSNTNCGKSSSKLSHLGILVVSFRGCVWLYDQQLALSSILTNLHFIWSPLRAFWSIVFATLWNVWQNSITIPEHTYLCQSNNNNHNHNNNHINNHTHNHHRKITQKKNVIRLQRSSISLQGQQTTIESTQEFLSSSVVIGWMDGWMDGWMGGLPCCLLAFFALKDFSGWFVKCGGERTDDLGGKENKIDKISTSDDHVLIC